MFHMTPNSAPFRRSAPLFLLIGILLAAAALRLINLSAVGDGNLYYTAAVASMVQSPANFFFAAAEPGGSVTVDKPPLGLMIQALFAAVFGVSGVVVVLPQIITGVLSVLLLYHLIARTHGAGAGLAAALALAVTPISVVTDRNNTMDSTLILMLLLAAWAFLKATESRKIGWLIVGGVLVGLGFNIKMLQAFLPVPAFLTLYLLGARLGWRAKIIRLIAALGVLLSVSFSWALIVDSIPPDARPYIGSSQNNSVMDLIFGYNGLERLNGVEGAPGAAQGLPVQPQGGVGAVLAIIAGNPVTSEVGEPGFLRLFKAELGNELAWMLPLALMTAVYGGIQLLIRLFKPPVQIPIRDEDKGVVLWGGWLIICVVFFSVARFFHAYYLATAAPAAAAMIGIGFWYLWKFAHQRGDLAFIGVLVAFVITLVIQGVVAAQYTVSLSWLFSAGALIAISLILMALQSTRAHLIGFVVAAAAIMIAPTLWILYSVLDPAPNVTLPMSYEGETVTNVNALGNTPVGIGGGAPSAALPGTDALIAYLQENTTDVEYLLAVPNAMMGAQFILSTRRPVLLLGGFSGNDPVIDAEEFAEWVNDGRIRYLLSVGTVGGATSAEISAWAADHCTPVEDILPGMGGAPQGMIPRAATAPVLYDCRSSGGSVNN